jgi:hypothetical protein
MISIITPAHNEKLLIEKCLCSVKAAAKEVSEAVEHIVVLNRFITMPGQKSPNHRLHLTAETRPI